MLTKKIVVTGGSGRFGKTLKNTLIFIIFSQIKELNILNLKSIKNYLKKKTKIFNSLSGLSRPMSLHEKYPTKSIMLNIIEPQTL